MVEYVRSPDSAFAWRNPVRTPGWLKFELDSQRYRGSVWRHAVCVALPKHWTRTSTGILYATGGDPNPLDLDEAQRLATSSGLPVAMLFHIPNQPMFDLSEDALIAETFVRYIETGDSTWPLLMPMANAAIRAIDAIEAATEGRLSRFVVTGASKRGWTAWLAAATGDPRIVGIAPMVFDNLNAAAQIPHQIETWGEPSEMIEDYTARGLHKEIDTPAGQRLLAMVDPYSYRDALTLPKLILNGANDPYWAVDALSRYWDGLSDPKWACVVPNAGHGTDDDGRWAAALSAFARMCSGGATLPSIEWKFDGHSIRVASGKPYPSSARLWVAESDSLDFRDSAWSIRLETGSAKHKGETWQATLPIAQSRRNLAALVECQYDTYTLTTESRVFPA